MPLSGRYRKQKARVYDILGRVCVRCGFTDERALQIDHIRGGGWRGANRVANSDTPNNKGYSNDYLQRIADDPEIKEKYQILCANCNWIKRAENKEHRYAVEQRAVESLQTTSFTTTNALL